MKNTALNLSKKFTAILCAIILFALALPLSALNASAASVRTVTFSVKGGTARVVDSTATAVSAAKSANWINVSRSGNTFIINAASSLSLATNTGVDRTGTVVLRNKAGKVVQTVTVRQSTPYLKVSTSALNLAAVKGSKASFIVTSNCPYTLSKTASFFDLSAVSGGSYTGYNQKTSKTFTVTANSSNAATVAKNGSINIKRAGVYGSMNLKVTQAPVYKSNVRLTGSLGTFTGPAPKYGAIYTYAGNVVNLPGTVNTRVRRNALRIRYNASRPGTNVSYSGNINFFTPSGSVIASSIASGTFQISENGRIMTAQFNFAGVKRTVTFTIA